MHRRLTLGRWMVELWTGPERRARALSPRGVALTPAAADLAARLTAGLATRVLLRSYDAGTAVYLLDADGQPLRNHGGGKQADEGGRELAPIWPILVALIPDDPALGYGSQRPVTVVLDPVPGTSVGYAGSRGDTVADAAVHIIRHYGPALDSTGRWEWDTPWRETPA